MVNGREKVLMFQHPGLPGSLTLTKDPSLIAPTLRMTDDSSEKQRCQGYLTAPKLFVDDIVWQTLIAAVLTQSLGAHPPAQPVERPGVPAATDTSAFIVPDRPSPAYRADDKVRQASLPPATLCKALQVGTREDVGHLLTSLSESLRLLYRRDTMSFSLERT